MKFDDQSKIVNDILGNWFGFGVHKVQLVLATADKTENGKEFIEVHVVGSNSEEDSARVWFTTPKAANYSFNVLRQIIIHATKEADRDKVGAEVDAVVDTDALAALVNEKCIGKELWFTKYESPDRTYTAKDGSLKKSIDKNIMGYEPKPRTGQEQKPANDVPFESAGDASATVPKDSEWAN